MKFSCRLCENRFDNYDELKEHECCVEALTISSSIAKKYSATNSTAANMRDESNRNAEFTCDICFDIFKDKCELEIHLILHKTINSNSVTQNSSSVNSNCRQSDAERRKTCISNSDTELPVNGDHELLTNFPCGVCNIILCSAGELEIHKINHEAVTASESESHNKESQNVSSIHQASESIRTTGSSVSVFGDKNLASEQFICIVCKVVLPDAAELQKHETLHKLTSSHEPTKEASKTKTPVTCNIYTCSVCKKKFYNKVKLEGHLKFGHKDIVYCRICLEIFENEAEKLAHVKVHESKCKECGKIFAHLKYLGKHMRTTHVQRMKECDICHKMFRAGRLPSHKQRSHTMRTCEICGLEVLTGSLTIHKRTHYPKSYSCPTCKKTYKTAKALRNCKNRHTNNKPYKCDECEKAYFYQESLTVHKRLHTGEKPYVCKICSRSFYAQQILYKHLLSHERI